MNDFTIGEITQRTGITSSAIRYYEQIGLLPPPRRINGWRRYDADVLLSLRCIQLAQQAGFKLSEIREFLGGLAAAKPLSSLWRQFAERKFEELNEAIAQAQARQQMLSLLLRCECQTLTQCSFINEDAQPCPE
jgi:MerR family transcriptional regulator, redox-sensitive transcriptional activator SoxR